MGLGGCFCWSRDKAKRLIAMTKPTKLAENFYSALPAFEQFKGITSDENYAPVPRDWWVFVADVTNSTVAVTEGRYKDINTIGAAAIVVAHEVMGTQAFPFVFGGDGATMVVPPDAVEKLSNALIGLQALSQTQFGLDLRVGKIQVCDIVDQGADVRVAKMSLAGEKSMSIFAGGGLTLADKLIKSHRANHEVRGTGHDNNLKKLSCRWQPVLARHGNIASLVISPTKAGDMGAIADFVDFLDDLYGGNLADANPIGVDHMSYHSVSECIAHEKRMHHNRWSIRYVLRVMEIMLAVAVFRFNVPPIFFNPNTYGQSLGRHSDYRKFDDTLKMTIDCSDEQLKKIKAYLSNKHAEGRIIYGIHETDTALMTCFVDGLGEGRHIHFIDGGDGGYFSASLQYKSLNRPNHDDGQALPISS